MDKDYNIENIRKNLLNSDDGDLIFAGKEFSNHKIVSLAKCFDEKINLIWNR